MVFLFDYLLKRRPCGESVKEGYYSQNVNTARSSQIFNKFVRIAVDLGSTTKNVGINKIRFRKTSSILAP